jgi:hypothetical protein
MTKYLFSQDDEALINRRKQNPHLSERHDPLTKWGFLLYDIKL